MNVTLASVNAKLEDVNKLATEAKAEASLAKRNIESVEKRVSKLERQLLESQTELSRLHDKSLQLESYYSRRENLTFEGIPENKTENISLIINDIFESMDLSTSEVGSISRAHRLGCYNKSPRPIIVRFGSTSGRDLVWQKRNSLSGSKIWIKEDYPIEIENKRKILMPYYRAARCGNPDAPESRVRAYMRADKLIINNDQYTVDDIVTLPRYVKSAVEYPPSSRKSINVTIFFTKHSPFSNFYLSQFESDGKIYNCVEQYLCYHKAKQSNADDIADVIMDMDSPNEQKQKVKHLPGFNQVSWRSQVDKILTTALEAKFSQDADLKEVLLRGGGKGSTT